MYFTSNSDALTRLVIDEILAKPGLRFSTLQRRLESQQADFGSRATLYRKVSELVDRNIIVREGTRLLPNLVWVTAIGQLADKLRAASSADTAKELLDIPSEIGRTVSYKANSMSEFDPLVNHILIELAHRFDERDWCAYAQHPWFLAGMSKMQRGIWNILVEVGRSFRMLYGNNGFLDRHALSGVSIPGFDFHFSATGQLSDNLQAFWCCDNYVIEIVFDKKIVNAIESFFQKVKSVESFDLRAYQEILKMRGECHLALQRNPKKAMEYKRLIDAKIPTDSEAERLG